MPKSYPEQNRLGITKGQIAVSVTRYLEGLQGGDRFKSEVFRRHTVNIEQMIGPALDRYADDLFQYLLHRLVTSGQITKKGDSLESGIPLSESAQRTWLRKALRDWQANFPK